MDKKKLISIPEDVDELSEFDNLSLKDQKSPFKKANPSNYNTSKSSLSAQKSIEYNKSIIKNHNKDVYKHIAGAIPLVSSIILDPLSTYVKYGQFPRKLMVHLLLLILSSSYAFLQNERDQTLLNPQIQSFYYYFLNPDNSSEDYNQLTEEYPKTLLLLDV